MLHTPFRFKIDRTYQKFFTTSHPSQSNYSVLDMEVQDVTLFGSGAGLDAFRHPLGGSRICLSFPPLQMMRFILKIRSRSLILRSDYSGRRKRTPDAGCYFPQQNCRNSKALIGGGRRHEGFYKHILHSPHRLRLKVVSWNQTLSWFLYPLSFDRAREILACQAQTLEKMSASFLSKPSHMHGRCW